MVQLDVRMEAKQNIIRTVEYDVRKADDEKKKTVTLTKSSLTTGYSLFSCI